MFGSLLSLDNLFDEIRQMERNTPDLFGRPWAGQTSIRAAALGAYPKVNVGSAPDAVHVYVFAPGLELDKLDLSLQRNVLSISGERQIAEKSDDSGAAGYHLRERFSGNFRRVITLPDDVDPDQVEARYRDGVLHVRVARRESARPRQIEVTHS